MRRVEQRRARETGIFSTQKNLEYIKLSKRLNFWILYTYVRQLKVNEQNTRACPKLQLTEFISVFALSFHNFGLPSYDFFLTIEIESITVSAI